MTSQIVNAHCPFDYALFKDAVCVMGVFDGVHLGHRKLINFAIGQAKSLSKRCIIITFNIDPDEIFDSSHLEKIMKNSDRLKMLSELGADSVAVLPFDEEFAALLPLQFLSKIFLQNTPYSLHIGENFHFGKNTSGDISTLRIWAQKNKMEVHVHELLKVDSIPVSSTRIRQLIDENQTDKANLLKGW